VKGISSSSLHGLFGAAAVLLLAAAACTSHEDAGAGFDGSPGPGPGPGPGADGPAGATGPAATPQATPSGTAAAGCASDADCQPGAACFNGVCTGGANTNINFGGAQDFGFFRRQLDAGRVPRVGEFTADGFFAEHHTPLPPPACGERVCVQAMLGVMSNLMNGQTCTLLQVGLNSVIAADPDQRPPLTLAVVVDVSGSMRAGDKIEFVRRGLHILIDALRDEDQIALVTYDTDVAIAAPMDAVFGRRHVLRAAVDGLQADGGTNLYGGLEAGYREVMRAYDSGRQNRVILLSDGQPTAGITAASEILAMSAAYNSDGIGLTTVGLGVDFNVRVMQGLAQQGDGNFYFLENAGAVDEVFTEEVSFFTVPVVFDLDLEVRAGADYTLRRAYGAPLWEDTAEGGHLDVPSVFLAHRVSHDDVTDAGGRRGGGSALLIELMPRLLADDGRGLTEAQIATIDVSFREPGTDRTVTDHVVVDYPHAPWVTLSTGFFDAPDTAIIQKSFVMLNIYAALEMACEMFHARVGSDAVTLLRRVIAAVEDYNDEVDDTDITFDLALLRQLVDVLLRNGVADPEAPPVTDDPWPAD
jgi:Ca-activated chloride channel family protein